MDLPSPPTRATRAPSSSSASRYREGQGVQQDYAEAVKWIRLVAHQGDEQAQAQLGVMYEEGNSVPQDDAEAAKWYRRAAEQGNARAQLKLGAMYRLGQGVQQDAAGGGERYTPRC